MFRIHTRFPLIKRGFAALLAVSMLVASSVIGYASEIETEESGEIKEEHLLYAAPTQYSSDIGVFADGDSVVFLEHINDSWSLIRLSDGTEGYCDRNLLGVMYAAASENVSAGKIRNAAQVRCEPQKNAPVLCPVPAGTTVEVLEHTSDKYCKIKLPNNTVGYIPVTDIEYLFERGATVRVVPVLTAYTGITTDEEAEARLKELSAYFQHGKYWNCIGSGNAQGPENLYYISDTPCAHPNHGYRYCNVYTGSMSRKAGYGIGMQCLGYVGLLSDLTFGTDAPIYSHGNFDKVRPGDHVRLVLWDHSMLVTRVCKDENGRTYFYATDVNADYDTCMIQWERKFTKEELRRLGDYVCVYTRYPQE